VNLDDVREILALMRDNGLSEFEIEREGLRLRLRKDTVVTVAAAQALPAGTVAPVVVAAPAVGSGTGAGASAAAPATDSQAADEIELAVVKSPIVGTFYRSSEPSAPAFVQVGTTVKKGQVLCIIEAMKLMNEIDSEYDGEIMNVYVENGQPVQYGERLFAIRTT
jgi:acetyl-CoA carboxylase biotin carboxyl carrier protein